MRKIWFTDNRKLSVRQEQAHAILRTHWWLRNNLHESDIGCGPQKVHCEKSPDSSGRCPTIQWVSSLVRSLQWDDNIQPKNVFNFRKDLIRIYANLDKLNDDLASSYQIRKQNFIEMQKSLDAVNSVLKSSIRLRGEFNSNQLWIQWKINEWHNFQWENSRPKWCPCSKRRWKIKTSKPLCGSSKLAKIESPRTPHERNTMTERATI